MQKILLNQDGKLVKDEAELEESLLKLYDACFLKTKSAFKDSSKLCFYSNKSL